MAAEHELTEVQLSPISHPVLGMPSEEQVQRAFSQFWVLANPTRIRLLCGLLQGQHDIPTLARLADCTPSAAVEHLRKLQHAGLVQLDQRRSQVRLPHNPSGLRTLLTQALQQPSQPTQSTP